MPTFIVINLGICYLQFTQSEYIASIGTNTVVYIGIAGLISAIACALSKRIQHKTCYDILACSVLISWYSYWLQHFRHDAPMFIAFPLFFVAITALLDITLINKRYTFDQESIETIRFYSDLGPLHPAIIITGLLISTFLTEHYLLFPVLMNAYIVRYTLSSCLEQS